MSPSKSLKFDSGPQSGEQLLLQKLDEVGTSVKVMLPPLMIIWVHNYFLLEVT